MEAINEIDTVFTSIFSNDIKYKYGKWYYRLKVHVLKFLAEEYFGVSDLEDGDNDWEITEKIVKKILNKSLRYIIYYFFIIYHFSFFVIQENCDFP